MEENHSGQEGAEEERTESFLGGKAARGHKGAPGSEVKKGLGHGLGSGEGLGPARRLEEGAEHGEEIILGMVKRRKGVEAHLKAGMVKKSSSAGTAGVSHEVGAAASKSGDVVAGVAVEGGTGGATTFEPGTSNPKTLRGKGCP